MSRVLMFALWPSCTMQHKLLHRATIVYDLSIILSNFETKCTYIEQIHQNICIQKKGTKVQPEIQTQTSTS
eukprot:m.132350 g.132350  ORF g.132350 m.132350 type:complete len:71 (+) comp13933_c0_seq1:3026-3238(+)